MEGISKEESLSVLTAIITTRMTGGHQEYLRYYKRDASKFVVMKNETYHHPRRGHRSRKYMWSCAMTGPMGVKSMIAGTYDLKWFDTVDGDIVAQTGVSVSSGDITWTKPDSMGRELALYIKRLGD